MVFVIKATLKDETRRLTFDRTTFPLYSDIQAKVSQTRLLLTYHFITYSVSSSIAWPIIHGTTLTPPPPTLT